MNVPVALDYFSSATIYALDAKFLEAILSVCGLSLIIADPEDYLALSFSPRFARLMLPLRFEAL
jgi:hypothetical protein